MDLRLVLFDFDGVIADSEPAHFEMFRRIFQEEGLDFSWDEYVDSYLGYTDKECFYHRLRELSLPADDETIATLVARKKVIFARYLRENSIILEGVREFLDDLRANKITCSICSGALRSEIEFILRQADLLDYFSVIIAAEDVSQGKPDPQGYQLCLRRTNEQLNFNPPVTAEQCLVIEDSIWGIQAAQRADMCCLAVQSTYPAEALKVADMVIPDLKHISVDKLKQLP